MPAAHDAARMRVVPAGYTWSRPAAGTTLSPIAYSERLTVKLPNTGDWRWPSNSRVLW
ncbi:hypothetical protein D3C81_514190 [compost metagenome]